MIPFNRTKDKGQRPTKGTKPMFGNLWEKKTEDIREWEIRLCPSEKGPNDDLGFSF